MNKERNQNTDILVLSASLFSMFFGAGNLIFPSYIGFNAGSKWFMAMVGFLITGAGLPLLGVVASGKSNGDIDDLGKKVSPIFSKFLGIAVVLSIGPLMAIPRTGATTFEMAIKPLLPNFSPVVFAFIYFGLAYALVVNPKDIVDKIGKILTPALIILLAMIIILGIKNPIGEISPTSLDYAFTHGFKIGYQTMDAFAALLFSGVIILAIQARGYEDKATQVSMTLKSGLIAITGLALIYGGLGYLGATAVDVLPKDISKVELIMILAENSLKSFGKIGFSIVVALACLTTSIGLISTVGSYFNKLSKGGLSYRLIITITTIVSGILSVVGVDNIVKFSGPVLSFLYPIVIVLIFLTVFLGNRDCKKVFQTAIGFTMVISLLQLLVDFDILDKSLIMWLPLADMDLAWLVPAILGSLIGMIINKNTAS